MAESESSSSSSSTGSYTDASSSSSGSWELKGEPHPKYFREGGYYPVSVNEMINSRYRIIQKLGHGYFSIVYLVYDYDYKDDSSKNGRTTPFKALKIQKSSRSSMESAEDEIKMYRRLGTARYVAMMFDNFKLKGKFGIHTCMVFPLLGTNLDSLLKNQGKIPFPIVKTIVTQTMWGLLELKKKNIIHADLKTENVLLSMPNKKLERVIRMYRVPPRNTQPKLIEKSIYVLTKSQRKRQKRMIKAGEKKSGKQNKESAEDSTYCLEDLLSMDKEPVIKICDLGSACPCNDKYGTEVQTKHYMAPEVLLGNDYDCAIDVWSLGCIAYELVSGELLFDCDSDSEMEYQENHLANIVETVGTLPEYMITGGKYSKRYVTLTDKNGLKFKHIKKLAYQSIFDKLRNNGIDDAKEISEFIAPFLTVDMKKRSKLFYS